MTPRAERLGAVLMRDPTGKHYGYDTLKCLPFWDQRFARFWHLMEQFMETGWLVDGWDDIGPVKSRRRWYRLTDEGRRVFGR